MTTRDPRYADGHRGDVPAPSDTDHHGPVRRFVRSRPGTFRGLRRRLRDARVGTTVDVYVARSAAWSLRVGGAVAVLAALAGAVLGGTSHLPAIGPSVTVGVAVIVPGTAATSAAVAAIVAGTTAVSWRLLAPSFALGRQKRAIDALLPNAVVYMYALSKGGVNLVEMIQEVADERRAYDEVAHRFEAIARDVELMGDDLFTALQNARDESPSAGLAALLDDLVTVLQSGGSIETFLEHEMAHHLELEQEEQEEFLELLGTFAEGFVTVVFAGTVFLLIVLVMLSISGADVTLQIYLLIYVGIPALIALALAALMVLTEPYTLAFGPPEPEDGGDGTDAAGDERFERYEQERRRRRIRHVLSRGYRTCRDRPTTVLYATVPASLTVLLVAVATRWGEPALGLHGDPIGFTVLFVVAPLLVTSVPLSLFTELHHRRNARLSDRFPNVLEALANARENGVPLGAAIELVARESGGSMADEMAKIRRDIALTDDVGDSFMAFAGRVKVGSISRAIHVVARGFRYTSDVGDVLRVTAEDLRNRRRLQRERTVQMRLYTIVFVLGVLIYLGIVVLLVRSFFPQAEAMAEAGSAGDIGMFAGDVAVNLTAYRTAFFHSALLQVVGTSLVVGRLERNDVLSGLKYANVLTVVVVGVFLVL